MCDKMRATVLFSIILALTLFASLGKCSPLERTALAKRASVGQAPLDLNNEISGTLNTLSSLVGVLGHSSSTLVMSLAGVSITDCATQIKDQDLNNLSCEDFLQALSECDSLANVKPLLQQAKEKYKKQPNSKAPCFKNKKSKKSKSKKP